MMIPPTFTATPSPSLSTMCDAVVADAAAHFAGQGVAADEIGLAVALLDRGLLRVETGDHAGGVAMYPASVVKLFYLGYLAHLLDTRHLTLTPELSRAAHDMIVDSNNDATGLILDAITGTTGGPELGPSALKTWMSRRQSVNRWYAKLGYPALNACQKTWNEGPYGRERQGYGSHLELRNSLSPTVACRWMTELALDQLVSPAQSAWMKTLLKRAIPADDSNAGEQATRFSGKVLPSGTQLWSKAGWTDEVQHDVAYVRLPSGQGVVWAIFSRPPRPQSDLVPYIARKLLEHLSGSRRVQ